MAPVENNNEEKFGVIKICKFFKEGWMLLKRSDSTRGWYCIMKIYQHSFSFYQHLFFGPFGIWIRISWCGSERLGRNPVKPALINLAWPVCRGSSGTTATTTISSLGTTPPGLVMVGSRATTITSMPSTGTVQTPRWGDDVFLQKIWKNPLC